MKSKIKKIMQIQEFWDKLDGDGHIKENCIVKANKFLEDNQDDIIEVNTANYKNQFGYSIVYWKKVKENG